MNPLAQAAHDLRQRQTDGTRSPAAVVARVFNRPSLSILPAPVNQTLTLSLADLAAESDRYRPGYFEAVLAARIDVETPAHVITIDSSALETLRRQHAPGCCGR